MKRGMDKIELLVLAHAKTVKTFSKKPASHSENESRRRYYGTGITEYGRTVVYFTRSEFFYWPTTSTVGPVMSPYSPEYTYILWLIPYILIVHR